MDLYSLLMLHTWRLLWLHLFLDRMHRNLLNKPRKRLQTFFCLLYQIHDMFINSGYFIDIWIWVWIVIFILVNISQTICIINFCQISFIDCKHNTTTNTHLKWRPFTSPLHFTLKWSSRYLIYQSPLISNGWWGELCPFHATTRLMWIIIVV